MFDFAKWKSLRKSDKGKFAGDLGLKAVTELLSAVFGILTFGVLSRMLSKSDYAVVNQTIAIGALLAPIMLFKLNNAFCIFFAGEKDQKVLKSRFFSSLISCLPICLIVFLGLYCGRDYFAGLMFDSVEYAPIMLWMAVYFILLALSTLTQDFYRAIRQINKSSWLLIIKAVATGITFMAAAAVRNLLVLKTAILIYCLMELLIFAIGFLSILRYFKGVPLKLEFPPLKEYYVYALPLMPFMILNWINSFISRFILTHLLNLEISGIYSFNHSLVSRAFFLNAVIAYTIFPYISKFWNEGDKEKVIQYMKKAFNIGIFIALPMMFGIIATAPTIVSLLSGGNYPSDRLLIAMLCAAMTLQMLYNIFAFLIDLSRRTVLYNLIFFITSVLNILLNFALIPGIGIYGAGLATLITFVVQFLLTLFIGSKVAEIRISIDWLYCVKTVVITLVMYFVTRLIYADGGVWNFLLSVCAGVVIYFGLCFAASKLTKKPLV